MFEREIEIFRVRKSFPDKIGFVDVLQKEVPIRVGTDENRHNTEKQKESNGDGTDIIKQKFFRTDRESEFAITRKILIDDNADEWEGCYESHYVGIEENAHFGDIPMKKILIEENDIFENLFEIGEIGSYHNNENRR